jgi:hypothetical protein
MRDPFFDLFFVRAALGNQFEQKQTKKNSSRPLLPVENVIPQGPLGLRGPAPPAPASRDAIMGPAFQWDGFTPPVSDV